MNKQYSVSVYIKRGNEIMAFCRQARRDFVIVPNVGDIIRTYNTSGNLITGVVTQRYILYHQDSTSVKITAHEV